MIDSMTGFGSAEGQLNGVTYAVEIKAVNNRYFKARIKLPDMVAFLEDDIEKLLQRNLPRGTVNYTLRLKNISANVLFNIDEEALKAYMQKLQGIVSAAGVNCPIDMGSLLSLPGVVMAVLPDEEQAERVRNVVLDVTQEALNKLKQMRATEGTSLAADLESNCEAIKKDLEQIHVRSPIVVKEYQDKLRKRIDDLLASAKLKLDKETLAREVAVFAERSDISEEISRLESHLQQFIESCNADGQAGRRLDFISQEMLREANTIASKASDTEIIHCVVDMKCRIDRIKEQIQNVE
jgi:uncharacterized protein (TIGR00255 family)